MQQQVQQSIGIDRRTRGGLEAARLRRVGNIPFSIWYPDRMFPGGGFLLEGRLIRERSCVITLHLKCPRCTGGVELRSDHKRLEVSDNGVSTARFGCPWGERYNPCGWEGQLVEPPPGGTYKRDSETGQRVRVDALIR